MWIYHYPIWWPLSPHICAPSNLIVSLTSHLSIIKFDCLSHLLLVPGDLEEQEQRPNLDPRRRRRLKTSPKPPDYLHLQYLTIYFPVPLKRVFINVSNGVFSRCLRSVFHLPKLLQILWQQMPSTSSRDEIHMPLENMLMFYLRRSWLGQDLMGFRNSRISSQDFGGFPIALKMIVSLGSQPTSLSISTLRPFIAAGVSKITF